MTRKVSFSQLRDKPSPFKAYQWLISFHNVPAEIAGQAAGLELYAETSTTPDKSFEKVESTFLQHTIEYASKVNKNGTITVNFEVDKNQRPKDFFSAWQNLITNNSSGTGIPHPEYTAVVEMVTVDDSPSGGGELANETATYRLILAWPEEVPGLDLDQNSSDKVTFDVTFSYSSFTEDFEGES